MGFGSRMKTTEPSDESTNTMNPPVLHYTNTRKFTVLLERSWRTAITVGYPAGINIHKTNLWPACPRTGGLLSAVPRPPAVAIQLRLAVDTARSQLEKLPKGSLSGGARLLGLNESGWSIISFWRR